MAEIIKTYKQSIPAMRFIGKKYGDGQYTDWGYVYWGGNWGDAFAFDVFGKVESASGGEDKSHSLYEDNNGYIGLCYRNAKTGAYDAWVGMFAPPETKVDEGLDYIDFPSQNLGVCWIYGKENEVHGLIPQCSSKIISAGMEIRSDEHGYIGFFERDQCPRFTTPDEKGNVILDYGFYLR